MRGVAAIPVPAVPKDTLRRGPGRQAQRLLATVSQRRQAARVSTGSDDAVVEEPAPDRQVAALPQDDLEALHLREWLHQGRRRAPLRLHDDARRMIGVDEASEPLGHPFDPVAARTAGCHLDLRAPVLTDSAHADER